MGPTTGCDGPFSDKDNGGTNMNTGGETASADACKQECEATDGCKGYTWKTDSTQCWLKSSVDEYVVDALSASGDCNGGTPTPAPTTGCDGPFSDKDNGGTNMNTGGETTSADACKQECEATDGCKGYTWKTDSTQCWLKSSVDEYVADALSASGDCNGGTPTPAPGCDGPFSDKDNGGTNMNTGGKTTSADACK